MKMLKNSSVLVILYLILLIQCKEEDDNNDIFLPTKEWQIVKKGQKIPKGLHIRINLETGQTEAKLLDEDQTEDKTKALSAIPQEIQEKILDEKIIPKSTLEEAVKNIKGDDLLKPDDFNNLKDQFRSYDELKKSLKDLNLAPKTDAEIITDLLEKNKEVLSAKSFESSKLLKLLEDLDFLVHQYDNANEFIRQNGFSSVIYKNLNQTDPEIRKSTLKLMSALLQNNVTPKIHALESGSVAILLRLISLDPDSGVKHRALTALGTLLRSFPAAQKKFIDSGGLEILSKFFDHGKIDVQIRLITMISDLIIEHKLAFNDEKLSKYYTKFDLTKNILALEWCKKLNKLLLGLLITDQDDHDSIEKCLTAMHSLRAHCGDAYEAELLFNLKIRYQKLSFTNSVSDDENDIDYFNNLKQLCDEILHHVHNGIKTEL